MSLDLAETVHQIEGLTRNLRGAQADRWQRLDRAVEAMRRAPPEEVRAKLVDSSKRPFLSAGVGEGLGNANAPNSMPENFCVLSVDGSHIDVDRHMPVSCALINIGGCVLTLRQVTGRLSVQYTHLIFQRRVVHDGPNFQGDGGVH